MTPHLCVLPPSHSLQYIHGVTSIHYQGLCVSSTTLGMEKFKLQVRRRNGQKWLKGGSFRLRNQIKIETFAQFLRMRVMVRLTLTPNSVGGSVIACNMLLVIANQSVAVDLLHCLWSCCHEKWKELFAYHNQGIIVTNMSAADTTRRPFAHANKTDCNGSELINPPFCSYKSG